MKVSKCRERQCKFLEELAFVAGMAPKLREQNTDLIPTLEGLKNYLLQNIDDMRLLGTPIGTTLASTVAASLSSAAAALLSKFVF